MEPCGIPRLVSNHAELQLLLEITIRVRPSRCDLIYRRAVPEKPNCFSFDKNLDGGIVPNALLKSNHSKSVTFLLYNGHAHIVSQLD